MSELHDLEDLSLEEEDLEEADQAAPAETTESPTETREETEEAVPTDPEVRAIELEFEIEQLRAQNAEFQEVKDFLDSAAKHPEGALGALAEKLGKSAPEASSGAFQWSGLESYDEPTKQFVKDIEGFVESKLQGLKTELAQTKAELAGVKPHVESHLKAKESEAKASAAVSRVMGVQKLIALQSETRNYGWKPSEEQIKDYVGKHPEILDGAKNAQDVAKAVVEKLRAVHLDDIIAHKAGKGKQPSDNRAAVAPKHDARGSNSAYEARKARVRNTVHTG